MKTNLQNPNMTSLQGELYAPYWAVVKVFGEPNAECDGYKTDAEWNIQTPHGVATIYNWKDGKNYLGDEGLELDEIDEWHIGGHNKETAEWIIADYRANKDNQGI